MFAGYENLIGHCRNVGELGKSMVVFRLFEKLRYSNERSTKFESLPRIKVFRGEKWLNSSSSNISQNRVCMDWVDRQQSDKGLYEILQLLKGSYLDDFPLKLLNLVG